MDKKFISGITAMALMGSLLIPSVESAMAAPAYIYSNESVPTWEKFKEDGNHKAYPEKTSFDISSVTNPTLKPLVKEGLENKVYIEKEDLNTKLTFSSEEKDFFEKITDIKLLLNNGKEVPLKFQKDKDSQTVTFAFPENQIEPFHEYVPEKGAQIILGYPVKVYASDYEPKVMPAKISGIDERVFVANTNMFGVARQGEDVTFKLYNFNPYVVTTEEKYRDQLFESITLITPSNKRKVLQMKIEDPNTTEVGPDGKDHPALKYKDWSLVGTALRLTASECNFDEVGNYMIEIAFSQREGEKHPVARGYFTISKTPGDSVKPPKETPIDKPDEDDNKPGLINPDAANENGSVDTVSRATGGISVSAGDGDSSGGGAGGSHALVVYDADMVANAWALHLLGYETEESTKIYERYKFETDQSGKFLSDETGEKYYELNRFKESVRVHEANGNYLNFTDYQDFGSLVRDRVSSIFYLLEDGTLGRMTPNHDNVGKIPPEIQHESMPDYREDLVLSTSNKDYLENLSSVEVNGKILSKDNYKIDGNQIIIKSSVLIRGNNSIIMMANGYKINEVDYELLPIDAMHGPRPKVMDGANANEELVLRGFDKYFADKDNRVYINLTAPGGEPEKLYEKSQSEGVAEKTFYFEDYNDKALDPPENGRKLVFSKECFPHPGVYTISIHSKHYKIGTFLVYIAGESVYEQPFTTTVSTDFTRLMETKPYDFKNKQNVKKVTIVRANNEEITLDKKTFSNSQGWAINEMHSNALNLYGYFLNPGDYIVVSVENGNEEIDLVYVEPEVDSEGNKIFNTKPEGFGNNPDPKDKDKTVDFGDLVTTGQWLNHNLVFKPDGDLDVEFVRPGNDDNHPTHDGSMDIYFFNYDEQNPLTKVYWQNPEMKDVYLRIEKDAIRIGDPQADGDKFYRALHLLNPDFTELNRYPGLDGNLKAGVKILLVFKDGSQYSYEIPKISE